MIADNIHPALLERVLKSDEDRRAELTAIKSFFNSQAALDVCSNFTEVETQCAGLTAIDRVTCLKLSFYNVFVLDQYRIIYGWLSYDIIARNTLYGRCLSQTEGFSSISEDFSDAFSFNFANLI